MVTIYIDVKQVYILGSLMFNLYIKNMVNKLLSILIPHSPGLATSLLLLFFKMIKRIAYIIDTFIEKKT